MSLRPSRFQSSQAVVQAAPRRNASRQYVLILQPRTSRNSLLRTVIGEQFGRAKVVRSGEELLSFVRKRAVRFVVCDMTALGSTGLQTLRQINTENPHLPLVAVVGAKRTNDAFYSMREGAWDCIFLGTREDIAQQLRASVRRVYARARRESADQGERALKLFSEAAMNARDPLAIIDSAGSIQFFNSMFAQMATRIGKSQLELDGYSLPKLLSGCDDQLATEFSLQLSTAEPSSTWRGRLHLSDHRGDLLCYALQLRAVEHDPSSQFVWFQNISELVQIEQRTEDLVSTTSHDLKGPLGSILNSVELIENGAPDESRDQQLKLCIASCARNALSIVDSLISVQQIARGVMPHAPQACSAQQIIEEVLLDYRPFAQAKGIALTKDIDCNSQALLDPMGFRRVASNLLHNAIKFTQVRGEVSVRLAQTDGRLTLSVLDNGPGIPAEDIPTLFQRYTRSPSQASIDGSGLGLFICNSIVHEHGGTLQVENVPQKGCCFKASFPQ